MTEIGAHRPDEKRGLLVFDGLPPDLQNAEDTTAAADLDRERNRSWWSLAVWGVDTTAEVDQSYQDATNALTRAGWNGWGRLRPATTAERTLLTHLGYELPDTLYTVVRPGPIRHRLWPQLENTNPTGETA